ncbi:MAG: type II secretion system protein [Phycisphaerales bacterium JB061]
MRSREMMGGRAFTLIELLVVIGIIAVLMGIGLSVGFGVINSGRGNATKSTLQMLETYLADLDATGEDAKSYRAFKTEVMGQEYEFPVADGRENSAGYTPSDRAIPSLMRFIAAGDTYLGDSSERWGGLDSSLVRDNEIGTAGGEVLRGVELLDAWDNPIRVVHPAYDGGFGDFWSQDSDSMTTRSTLSVSYMDGGSNQTLRLRRSYRPFNESSAGDNAIGDADEGICPNERVYFYSAGPDGDPGTREDNIYGSVEPRFPAETADFE